jgi:hypothetical protein
MHAGQAHSAIHIAELLEPSTHSNTLASFNPGGHGTSKRWATNPHFHEFNHPSLLGNLDYQKWSHF